MEQYLSKINNLIKKYGIDKYKTKIKTNKKNLNLRDLNKLLKKYNKNTEVFIEKEIKQVSNPRPEPIFKFDNENNVGYIKFFRFLWTNDIYMLRDLERIKQMVTMKLKIWEEKDYNKLIIDLTEHTGGYYISVVESLSYILGDITLFAFVKKQELLNNKIWINLRNNKVEDYPDLFRNSKFKFNGKIAVLISNKTNEGGEIVASVFKGRDNVKLIGSKTSGNILLLNTYLLDESEKLYIKLLNNMIQGFNNEIYDEGIEPDIKSDSKNLLKVAYGWLMEVTNMKMYMGKNSEEYRRKNKNKKIFYDERNIKLDYDNFKIDFNSKVDCGRNRIIFENREGLRTSLPVFTKYKHLQGLKYRSFESRNKKLENKSKYEYIREKFDLDIYNYNYSDSIKSTFNYLFDEMGAGIFCRIKNNKIDKFIPFSNFETKNKWHKNIKYPKEFKSVKEYIDYKASIFELRDLNSEYDMSKWAGSDCLIYHEKSFGKPFINSHYWTHLMYLIKYTLKNRKIADCTFFLNKKDPQILKKNRTQAFEYLWGPNEPLDIGKYYYFSPILSQSTRENYADIPIPTADDIDVIFQRVFGLKCSDQYLDPFKHFVKWEDKINTAFFRGSGTGCNMNVYKNQRLHLTKIHFEWEKNNKYNKNNPIDKVPFLNGGISKYNERTKVNDFIINFNSKDDLKKEGITLLDFVESKEQAKYKYILYIEGHSAAYRLGFMLSTNSLVLYVESKFKMWIDQFIKPNVHFIPIKSDYSDLAEKIEWCKKNDDKVKKIVENANKLMKKIMSKDFIIDYMGEVLDNIASKQFVSEEVYQEYSKYKVSRKTIPKDKLKEISNKNAKTLIIVPFRDNKFQDRKGQLNKFIKYWKNKDITIYIMEQTEDNRKFNRGQLLNMGIKYGLEKGFNNFVLHDVDLLPDNDLLEYYYYYSDIPVHIAADWDKYTFSEFFGGITMLNDKLLEKTNGFPNNMWGWGGEDDVLYNRCAKHINKIYIPNKGKVDEMKHPHTAEIKSIKQDSILKQKIILEHLNGNETGYKELDITKLNEEQLEKNIYKISCQLV